MTTRIDGPAADLPVSRAEIVDRAADVASRAGDLDRAAQLIADALAGIDPQQEPARAAILHERRGWCLLQRGRDDDALEAYEQAIAPRPDRAADRGSGPRAGGERRRPRAHRPARAGGGARRRGGRRGRRSPNRPPTRVTPGTPSA